MATKKGAGFRAFDVFKPERQFFVSRSSIYLLLQNMLAIFGRT
jgi:hypothetical protein